MWSQPDSPEPVIIGQNKGFKMGDHDKSESWTQNCNSRIKGQEKKFVDVLLEVSNIQNVVKLHAQTSWDDRRDQNKDLLSSNMSISAALAQIK
jgi:hypothetical protein